MNTENALAVRAAKPGFLVEHDKEKIGLKEVAKVVRPSYVKIVQRQSSEELTKKFGIGSIILTPDNMLVHPALENDSDVVVPFVPIFFYIEYAKFAPFLLKGKEPFVQERTTNPKSSIALKASNSATWSEL
jgi:hypothetical protein